MASLRRGRHRRPSKTAAVITSTAGSGIAASAIMASAVSPAQAQPVTHLAYGALRAPVAAAPAFARQTGSRQQENAEVTVISGDTLSGISRQHCPSTADWTGIYDANKKVIGGNYNLILPGQHLALDCRIAQLPAVTVAAVQPQEPQRQAPAGGIVSTAGMGAFQTCVITRESGGNPQVMNSSGHYGLYQFSYSTWVGHGGAPGDFGHAPAWEQTRVFWNAVRADGGSDWTPYDGCPF